MSTLTEQIEALQHEAANLIKEANHTKTLEVQYDLRTQAELLRDAAASLQMYRNMVEALRVEV